LAFLTSPSVAQTTADTIHQSVHAQTYTELYVPVPPQSLCKVRTPGVSEDLILAADDRGTILLHHWFPDTGMAINMSVDCTSEDGTGPVVSRKVEVRSVPDFEPAVSDTDYLALVPPVGKLIPALSGDPMSYSDKDLNALGYPSRPDPVQSPGEYSNWLDLVTHPRIIVSSRTVPMPGHKVSCTTAFSGYVLKNASCNGITDPIWRYVTGRWYIPPVVPGPNVGTIYQLDQWIGLGGTGAVGNPMPQIGTDTRTIRNADGSFTNYFYAWDEYYPNPHYAIPNFPATMLDQFLAEVTMVDTNGNPNKSGPRAKFTLCNLSRNPIVCSDSNLWLDIPLGYTYVGESAQWIWERAPDNFYPIPWFYGGTYTRMYYNYAKMSSRGSDTICGLELSPRSSGADYRQLFMYSADNCGGHLLMTSVLGPADSHGTEIIFYFRNYE
jgi:hypothetical protein